jgi:hypothetical protein
MSATYKLQQIVDAMREHELTKARRDAYINHDYYSNRDDPLTMPQILNDVKGHDHGPVVQACAIGEAIVQLAAMAFDCVVAAREDMLLDLPMENWLAYLAENDEAMVQTLEHCIPETAVAKEFKFSQFSDDTYPETFWRRAERWFSFSNEDYSRIDAILKAAEEFNIEVK